MSERKQIYHDANGVRRTLVTDDERPEDFAVHTEQVLDEILDSIERDRATMANGVGDGSPHPDPDLRARRA